ncbi:hypothetical protein WG66_006320 [Moniliophthora roreri]|nr:hypothetical protein WG66_006320 [Moniliophthora roreri]
MSPSPGYSKTIIPHPNNSNINPSPSKSHKEKKHSPRSTGKAGRNGVPAALNFATSWPPISYAGEQTSKKDKLSKQCHRELHPIRGLISHREDPRRHKWISTYLFSWNQELKPCIIPFNHTNTPGPITGNVSNNCQTYAFADLLS